MTFGEAVKAVPHAPDCYHEIGYCQCDRDERIAKGIEAACIGAAQASSPYGDNTLAAFIRAASL